MPPVLYSHQPIEDAVDHIRKEDGLVGSIGWDFGQAFIFIDQANFGMLRIKMVGEDKRVKWTEQVPYATHDTVGYVVQRAAMRAAL